MKTERGARGVPGFVLLLVPLLLALGLTFLHSATAGTSHDGMARRQAIALLAALPVAALGALLPLRWFQHKAYVAYGVGVLALVLVLFVGIDLNHSRRWFAGPAGFLIQPSELFRPLLILALARAFLSYREEPGTRPLLVAGLLLAVPCLLVRAEPDLGTALSYVPGALAMAYVAGVRRRVFVGAVLLAALGATLAMQSPWPLRDYQKERVQTFLFSIPRASAKVRELHRAGDVEQANLLQAQIREVKRTSGYQSHTALTSVGSGGVEGKGLGQGPQNRLGFLPERHNDFVFAVIAEELGLWGGVVVVTLYLALVLAVFQVAATARCEFAGLVLVGIGSGLVAQAFANIAMTLGLLPITGMPLPFVSQGGSSLLASLSMIGLVVSAGRAREGEALSAPRRASRHDPFGASAPGAGEWQLPRRGLVD